MRSNFPQLRRRALAATLVGVAFVVTLPAAPVAYAAERALHRVNAIAGAGPKWQSAAAYGTPAALPKFVLTELGTLGGAVSQSYGPPSPAAPSGRPGTSPTRD